MSKLAQMVKNIVILGNHIQALGISQIAGRIGIEVILFTNHRLSLASFSKYCKKRVLFHNAQDLLMKLMRFYNGKKETMLMPTDDMMVEFLMENYDVMNKHFFVSLPPKNITEICFNKIKTYQKSEELGIPYPDSRYPKDAEEARRLAGELRYPVIIKPAVMFRLVKAIGKKVLLCRNEQELIQHYALACKAVGAGDVIIQKIVPGGAKNLYSFGSFFANGNAVGGFVANRRRQRPIDFGSSTTFAVSVLNREIEESAIKFLNNINYFGLSEVEFMYDEGDKKYKLLEVNPRMWKWHSIANALDINLIKMLRDYFEEKELIPIMSRPTDIGWIDPFTDFFISIRCLIKRDIGFREYVRSLMIKKEITLFAKDDIMPTVMYVLLLPYLIGSRP